MPRFVIAFVTPGGELLHHVVELDSREAALRFFFTNHVAEGYSRDEEGFTYFREDFFDAEGPTGSILEV